jgi:hypothetical protein
LSTPASPDPWCSGVARSIPRLARVHRFLQPDNNERMGCCRSTVLFLCQRRLQRAFDRRVWIAHVVLGALQTSALGQKRTSARLVRNVCFIPESGHAEAHTPMSACASSRRARDLTTSAVDQDERDAAALRGSTSLHEFANTLGESVHGKGFGDDLHARRQNALRSDGIFCITRHE